MSGIRLARPSDLDSIVAIERLAFDPVRQSSRRALRRALESPRQRVLVCELDGRVVGFAILWCFPHTWRIYNVAIDPGVQRRGIGSKLLGATISAARAAGAEFLQLEARAEPDLVRLYRSHGFVERARLADYYASGDDAVRMRLDLR
jgi:[ribosomal protein S18]-alanine N-acetyltransferase